MNESSVFVPSNVLTFDTVSSDLARLAVHLKQHVKTTLVLNLEHVTHCDSAGLALLIQARRLCQEKQSVLRIEGMSQAILDLATFCDVDKLLIGEK